MKLRTLILCLGMLGVSFVAQSAFASEQQGTARIEKQDLPGTQRDWIRFLY